MSKKSIISGIFLFLFLLMSGNANGKVEPIYAGWTVGDSWDDGSGTSYGTILRSTDSGKTWIRQGEGQIAEAGLWGVFAVDPYTAWAVGDSDGVYGTIYHTTDGGSTWERKGSSNPASADYVPNVDLKKTHVVGDDVWVVGTSFDPSRSVILHTSDSGATWTNHMPAEYENIGLQGLYVVDNNTVFVGGGTRGMHLPDPYGIILKTTNAGLTWTSHDVDFDDTPIFDSILGISAADADTVWGVGGQGFVLAKSTDGGETWTNQSKDIIGLGDLNEVYAVNRSTVWVAGDNGVYWTSDGGEKWAVSANLPSGLATMGIAAVSAKEAWASHAFRYGGIFHTTDGGNTWTVIEQQKGVPLPGLWTISFATQPINLKDMITALIKDVEQLVDDGFLNKGQGNALIVKLERGQDRLVDDRLKAAGNVLNAFSNLVDALVRGGVMLPEDGQYLSDQVNYIIEHLFSPL